MAKRRRNGAVDPPALEQLELPKRARISSAERDPAVASWSTEDVTEYLLEQKVPERLLQAFEEHAIAGRHLLGLTEEDLTAIGISALGNQKDIMAAIKKLTTHKLTSQGDKVFNDPIHGHIELHPLMVAIVDTPQFQRLRYIKQLGGAYFVFPGASHNRFEHSIGVGYLAGDLVETLQKRQPELDITDKDVLCVKIAGLCHDLGHGPFSHMFDGSFIPAVVPDTKWKHEVASVMMFEHLVEENALLPVLEQYGLDSNDLTFIKEQIAGPLESETACSQVHSQDWPYIGRPVEKCFLYEIVANKRNGIDVDKWDYFARDCHCLGIPNNFDMRRYMKFARVISVDSGRRQICTRDKEVSNLYEMFHTRSQLHRRVYQHKTAKIIEIMITEALVEANNYLLFPGTNGPVKMSEAINDPVAYTALTDCVIQDIMRSTDPNLRKAQELWRKIERRQLYKCIGQTQPALSALLTKNDTSRLTEEIINSLSPDDLKAEKLVALTTEDIIVEIITFDYGMKEKNPIDHMRFYMKSNPEKAVKVRKDQVSQMLPQTFREQQIRVYCKKNDKLSHTAAWKYFINWCSKQDCITPKGGIDGVTLEEATPTPYNTPFGTPIKSDSSTPTALNSPDLIRGEVVKKLLSFTQ